MMGAAGAARPSPLSTIADMSEPSANSPQNRRSILTQLGLFAIYFFLIALALRDALLDPLYTNDAIDYMIVATDEAYRHPWDPMVDRDHALDTGHPLIIPYLCGVAWRVVGPEVWALHLAIWLCAATMGRASPCCCVIVD